MDWSQKTASTNFFKKINNSSINPITDPKEAIDFYMPLPDKVYEKWRSK
ncbi:MAG: hypothetical protein ABFD04_13505 [Syntrophomonas sp.]